MKIFLSTLAIAVCAWIAIIGTRIRTSRDDAHSRQIVVLEKRAASLEVELSLQSAAVTNSQRQIATLQKIIETDDEAFRMILQAHTQEQSQSAALQCYTNNIQTAHDFLEDQLKLEQLRATQAQARATAEIGPGLQQLNDTLLFNSTK